RALSSRQARAGLAFPARLPDQAAFHSSLLPALEPDRAVVGRHAQARHAQQMLRDMHPIRRRDARFPAGNGSPQLGEPMRFGHRQFPRHITQGFSGYGVNGVYITEAKSLGMRIIASFSKQLGARLTIKRDVPGSEFRLSIPLRP